MDVLALTAHVTGAMILATVVVLTKEAYGLREALWLAYAIMNAVMFWICLKAVIWG